MQANGRLARVVPSDTEFVCTTVHFLDFFADFLGDFLVAFFLGADFFAAFFLGDFFVFTVFFTAAAAAAGSSIFAFGAAFFLGDFFFELFFGGIVNELWCAAVAPTLCRPRALLKQILVGFLKFCFGMSWWHSTHNSHKFVVFSDFPKTALFMIRAARAGRVQSIGPDLLRAFSIHNGRQGLWWKGRQGR